MSFSFFSQNSKLLATIIASQCLSTERKEIATALSLFPFIEVKSEF